MREEQAPPAQSELVNEGWPWPWGLYRGGILGEIAQIALDRSWCRTPVTEGERAQSAVAQRHSRDAAQWSFRPQFERRYS
jgi:hypothetical protein